MNREYITGKHLWYLAAAVMSAILSLGLLLPHPYSLVVFVVPFAITIVVLTFARPFIGLMLYLVLFLVRPHEFVGLLSNSGLPIEKFFGFLLMAALFVKVAIKQRSLKPLRLTDYGILIFMAAAALSIPFSIWFGGSVNEWIKLIRLLVVYFLMTQLVDSQRQMRAIVVLMILCSIFHASAAAVNYYRGIADYSMGIYRAVGLDTSYGHPNSLAATLAFTFPFVYYLLPHVRSFVFRSLLLIGSAAMLWCIILTGSRTGMAGVIFFVLLVIWHARNRARNLVLAAVFLIVTAVAMPSQYQQRLVSITDLESDTGAAVSARGRIEGLLNGIQLLIDRPVFGYGIGNFGVATGMVYQRGWLQSHSLLGQVIGELGIVGTSAFILWLYFVFRELRILSKKPDERRSSHLFLNSMALSLKIQIYLLLFFGLGGHNLYRYNWYFISALAVIMLNIFQRSYETITPVDNSATQHPKNATGHAT